MWLAIHYLKPGSDVGIVENLPFIRVALGVLPVLLTNWLWLFFTKSGSYRFAFAAMVVGLLSLPFAVGVAVYEVAHPFGGLGWLRELVALGDNGQRLSPKVPIPEIVLALLVALAWDTYVAIKSRTLTSATIAGIHFLLLYLAVLDIKGLQYLFRDGLGYGGLWMLFAAGILGLAGVIIAKRPEPTGQSKPLFGIAIVVAILATQVIALAGPSTWGWKPPEVGIALFEILLGTVYMVSSIYLRNRFRVEGATAYLLLARLAPVAFLAGIGILESSHLVQEPASFPGREFDAVGSGSADSISPCRVSGSQAAVTLLLYYWPGLVSLCGFQHRLRNSRKELALARSCYGGLGWLSRGG